MKSRYEVRNPFTYDSASVSDENGLSCLDDSLTIQSEAEDADINTIVRRFGLTGQLPSNVRMPTPDDFVDVADSQMDYHSAMLFVKESDRAFMQFPVEVRQRFNHSPKELLSFLGDDKNREEAIKLGLVVKPAVAAPAASDASTASPPSAGAP